MANCHAGLARVVVMTDGKSGERTVLCPIEGCNREVLARGVNLHVRQSSDDLHGPQGEVPEGVGLEELETVGEESVQVDYPQDRKKDTNHVLCPFCYGIYKGKRGINIHLSHNSGKGQHPDDAAEQYELEEISLCGSSSRNERKSPSDRAEQYISHLLSQGRVEEAKQAKNFLLDRFK